jgi:hypothetical protein
MSEPLNAVIDISRWKRKSREGQRDAMVTVMVALSISQWCAASATIRAVSGGRPAGRPAARLADASGGS